MKNELCHAMRKGAQKADHKYIYREWKNGRWVYYYEDGTRLKELPKGMNYKTNKQVKTEQKATEAAKVELKVKEEEKTARKEHTVAKMTELSNKGKDFLKSLDFVLNTRVADLPKAIRSLTKDE